MSAEIVDSSGGILTFRFTGKLTHAEFAESQRQAGELIRQLGKVRFLAVLDHFEGLEKEGDWGDLSFQMEFDDCIEKIAIVGDKQWETTSTLFTGKGIRRIPIEFFQPADLPKAKAWVAA